MNSKRAVVLSAFGSSNIQGIEDSIKVLENDIKESLDFEVSVFIAFTSKIIIKILAEKGYPVMSLEDTLQYLNSNDFKEVIIQPLFMMDGTEYKKLKEKVTLYNEKFTSLSVNSNLLEGNSNDVEKCIKSIAEIINNYSKEDENILIVGHGSKESDNYIYEIIGKSANELTDNRVYMATLEGENDLAKVILQMKEYKVKKINIIPLFLMKGKHIVNDICTGENSWKSILESEGFEVKYNMKSLLEYEEIRRIYIEKINFSDNLQKY